MKIDDDQLKSALEITKQMIIEDKPTPPFMAERTAMATLLVAITMDIRRIADAIERLAQR